MIPLGTLCLIVNTRQFHELEGKTCTVIGPLLCRPYHGNPDAMRYEVDVPHPAFPALYACPFPDQLIPLTPPARKKSTKREKPLTTA